MAEALDAEPGQQERIPTKQAAWKSVLAPAPPKANEEAQGQLGRWQRRRSLGLMGQPAG